MLINAGHFWLHAPHRFNPGGNGLAFLGGDATNSLGDSRYNNTVAFGKFAAIPNGATNQTAWVLPRRSGGMSSTNEADFAFTPAGAVLGGVTDTGTATIGIDTNTPDGQLVATVQPGDAPASIGIATNTPELTASISGDGTSTIGFSVADALLGALGGMTVTTSFGIDGTLTSYAVGHMEGTTAEAGVTVDNVVSGVWSAILSDYADTGNAAQGVMDAGAAGNPWSAIIEDGMTAEEVLRIVAAVLAGKVSGAGTGTETFVGLDGVTDRVISTVDNDGNRTTVVVDGS
jgi:hypothetical protein